jgi:hypothetical protein
LTSPDILDRLPDNDANRTWLSHLASLGADIPPVCLPEPARMLDDLLDLAVPHEDIDAIIALAPSQDRNPDAWGLLERIVAVINSRMGEIDNAPTAPDLPGDDPLARYFHVYPLLALKPLVEDWHRQRGIPPDISRRTLADLGRNLAVHRKRFGTGGTSLHQWLQLHFRGAIYQLGRLQFQRWTLGETSGNAIRDAGHPVGPGGFALNVHITDFSGPMRPDLCDASFDRAREFFPTHFPQESFRVAMCHSWLLDPQLGDYLPERSNIIQFQRRFTLVERDQESMNDVAFQFVFGRKASEIDTLPRTSTVQRALIDHVRNGGHWCGGSGWLVL